MGGVRGGSKPDSGQFCHFSTCFRRLVEAVLVGRIGLNSPRHKLDSRLLICFDAAFSILQSVWYHAGGIMLQECRRESWLLPTSLIGFRRDAVSCGQSCKYEKLLVWNAK